jgi:hypothetical protein
MKTFNVYRVGNKRPVAFLSKFLHGFLLLLKQVLKEAQDLLLQCATPEAVVRLPITNLSADAAALFDKYFIIQEHGSLQQLVSSELGSAQSNTDVFLQVMKMQ